MAKQLKVVHNAAFMLPVCKREAIVLRNHWSGEQDAWRKAGQDEIADSIMTRIVELNEFINDAFDDDYPDDGTPVGVSDEHADDFVGVTHGMRGWFAVHYWLNKREEFGAFIEPWDSDMFSFATKEEAICRAREWAQELNIPCKEG